LPKGGMAMIKVEINVGVKLMISIREPHAPVVLPKSAWPHAFKVAFWTSNDQHPFGEAFEAVLTSTN
jgi:hypothetical protein